MASNKMFTGFLLCSPNHHNRLTKRVNRQQTLQTNPLSTINSVSAQRGKFFDLTRIKFKLSSFELSCRTSQMRGCIEDVQYFRLSTQCHQLIDEIHQDNYSGIFPVNNLLSLTDYHTIFMSSHAGSIEYLITNEFRGFCLVLTSSKI